MIRSVAPFLAGLGALSSERSSGREPWREVLEVVLAHSDAPVRIAQWGSRASLDELLADARVEEVSLYDTEESRCQYDSQSRAENGVLDKLRFYPQEIRRAAQPSRSGWVTREEDRWHGVRTGEGESAWDVVLIHQDRLASRALRQMRPCLAKNAIILWTGQTSWKSHESALYREHALDCLLPFPERFYLDQHRILILLNRPDQNASELMRFWERRCFLDNLFKALDDANVEFALLSNPGNLPAVYGLKAPIFQLLNSRPTAERISPESIPDIDVLVAKEQFGTACRILETSGLPPELSTEANGALYTGGETRFFFNQEHVVRLHLFGGLQYTALSGGRRVGLSPALQSAVIASRRSVNEFWRYGISLRHGLLHNLCRCVFDKHAVSVEYANLIEDAHAWDDQPDSLRQELEGAFFKFAAPLVQSIAEGRTRDIYERYVTFCDY